MSQIHDIGGMYGFGPIPGIGDEVEFHTAWEARIFAIVRALIANDVFNWDEFRHALERMAPEDYLRTPYFERWLEGVERLCGERGILTEADLAAIAAAQAGGDA